MLFTYHYNAQDRLIKVDDVNGSTIAGYFYDPFGRRLWKDVGSTRTYFFYADEGLVAEYDTSGTEIRAYGYRPDSTWTTDPLWLKQGGEYYFYQNDHLGTPQKLVQMNGAIAWSASYTAFGKANIEIETVTNNLRFPGQYVDAETGWHYNWFRYYDSNLGRYLRTDPIDLDGGINLFVYSYGNPLTYIDPTGLVAQVRKCTYTERMNNCLNKKIPSWMNTGGAYLGIVGGIFGAVTTVFSVVVSQASVVVSSSAVAAGGVVGGSQIGVGFLGAGVSAISSFVAAGGVVGGASVGIIGTIGAVLTSPAVAITGAVIGAIGAGVGGYYFYQKHRCKKELECDPNAYCKPCTLMVVNYLCSGPILINGKISYEVCQKTICKEDWL